MTGKAKHTVALDPRLYEEIRKIVEHSAEFESVDAYVNAVLEHLLQGEAASGLAPDEEKQIEQRLRDLGYL